MKILAVIPARFASTRFPAKPLALIHGKPMIQRVYESCLQSKLLDKVIVATDDERIYRLLETINADVAMTSLHHKNGTERIAEVARKSTEFDLIINIQGDEPCIHPKQIEELIELMCQHPEFKIGTLAKPISDDAIFDNRNAVKVHFKDNKAVSFARITKRKENFNTGKHIGIYAFRRKTLLDLVQLVPTASEMESGLEQLRWMENHHDIGIAWTAYESPSVDVPEDIAKVELYMRKNDE